MKTEFLGALQHVLEKSLLFGQSSKERDILVGQTRISCSTELITILLVIAGAAQVIFSNYKFSLFTQFVNFGLKRNYFFLIYY